MVFFFKQKTAYEMRISDWSSDVCSSDLAQRRAPDVGQREPDRYHHLSELSRCGGGAARLGLRVIRQAGVAAGRAQRADVRLGDQIGRASCRERVCQYV